MLRTSEHLKEGGSWGQLGRKVHGQAEVQRENEEKYGHGQCQAVVCEQPSHPCSALSLGLSATVLRGERVVRFCRGVR